MVFKTVDGHLTSVFNKVEKVKTGFNLTNDEVQRFVNDFNKLNSTQNFGQEYTDFIAEMTNRNFNVSQMFDDISKQGASARANVKDFYAAILDGNTKGFSNVKSTMALFNQAQQSGSENAKAFASAVGQSNTQLGNYLGGLNGAKASLVGYGIQLAITTAKTIALRAASMALNAALSWGISAVVSVFVSWLDKVIVTEKELAEQAKESAEKVNDQTTALENLKKKYEDICNSTDSEKTKNEQLNEIKQELIETYSIEKEHLKDLNLERENGIELLEKEIALKSQEERGNWLGTNKNKNAFNKAKSKINNPDYDASTDGTIRSTLFKPINKSDIRDSVKGLFSNIYDLGAEGNTYFEVAGDTLIEKYENLQKIITKLGNSKNLTRSEQYLLDSLNKEREAIQKILDENQEIYETGYKFTAENYFADYVNNNKVEDVGKETYLAWRNGLLETADGDKVLEQNLLALAEEQFPDYEEYYKNLDKAYSEFNLNSASEANKIAFVNTLDDTDLDILVNKIEDPFAEGIEGAKKLIADFKADPNNNITPTFDYSTYSEDVDKVAKNIDKVQSALDKLTSGKAVDNKDITELADTFPEYSTKILAASDDTEKLKAVLTEVKTNAPRSLIDTLSNLKDLSADDQEAVNGLITMLESLGDASSTYADILNDLDTKQSLLSSAYKEMHDDGQISVSTYQKLISLGDDYADVVSMVDGKLTLNVESLKELTKKKYDDEIATLRLARAEEWHNAVIAGKNGEDTSKYTKIIEDIDAEIEAKKRAKDLLDNYDYTTTVSSKKKSDDPWKEQFENEYNKKQHLLALNQISEEEYINWLDDAYKQYFSDLTKYQDEYWKYEEEVYKWRTEQEQELFDKKIDNYEKLADKALDDNLDADGNKLELSLSFDYAREQLTNAITELQQRINDIRSGVISGTEDDIEQLKEDIDSLNDKLKDIDDKEVTAERDFLKDKKDEYSDFYDEQIDKLKEQQDEAEKIADQEKEAIQAKIDLLEEVNSKKSEEIDLEKKRQELEKAKYQRTIARLNADGTTSYVADAEKINDAQEEYDNAKYEYQKSLLEAQIEVIEKAAKEQSEKYDDQIKLVEKQKKMIEEKFDALIKPLDDFLDGDKQTASNTNVWDMISKISGSTYENGVWSDKDGNTIDINSLVAGIDDLTEQEKENSKQNSEASQYKTGSPDTYELLAKYFQNKGMTGVTAELLEKGMKNFANNGLTFKNPAPNLSDNSAVKSVVYNNSRHTENITNNIGDIIINNPVGRAEDLGNEILKNGATIFNQQTHTNRK